MKKSKLVSATQYREAIKAITSKRGCKAILNTLEMLYQNEHSGCDDDTCSMAKAWEAGYSVMTFEMFASSGAASEEFYAAYRKLAKSDLQVAIRFEHESFRNDPECASVECGNGCGAYIYNSEFHGDKIHRSSCGKDFAAPAA